MNLIGWLICVIVYGGVVCFVVGWCGGMGFVLFEFVDLEVVLLFGFVFVKEFVF